MNDERVEAAAKAVERELLRLQEEGIFWRDGTEAIANAALTAADSVGMSGDGVAMAWAVNCPARHECDFLVFHDPQEAEVQAEQWNEDHDEGENPHKVIPLYPADDSASGEKVVYTATESTLFAKVFQGAPAGSSFFLQPGEELVVRKVRGT